mgnify:CR=1 FL=1
MKVEIECPLRCGKKLKISLTKEGKVSKKDYKARLRQHLKSKRHKDLWLPPAGSTEKLEKVLKKYFETL